MKNKFLIFALLIGLSVTGGTILYFKSDSGKATVTATQQTVKVNSHSSAAEACKELLDNRSALRTCIGDYMKASVKIKGYKETAMDIEASVAIYPEINVVCHSFAHYLGQGAWDKYHSIIKALNDATSFCAWGYLHGLNVAASADLKGDALLAELMKGCDYVDLKKGNKYECAHGIGDAMDVSSNYDLLWAFSMCAKIPDDGMHRNCSEGAMNNWTDYYMVEDVLKGRTQPKGVEKLLFKGQPYAICLEVPNRIDRNACLDYATHLIPGYSNGLADIEKACHILTGADNDGCFKGLGREYAFNPKVTLRDGVERCLLAENYMGVRVCAGDLINAKTQVYRDTKGAIINEACGYDISIKDERMVNACKSIKEALQGYFDGTYQL